MATEDQFKNYLSTVYDEPALKGFEHSAFECAERISTISLSGRAHRAFKRVVKQNIGQ
ncbi:Uncharacterised protein [Vibrio cholerae]|nr:Uncharacterised protein [Vibrio cholerae]